MGTKIILVYLNINTPSLSFNYGLGYISSVLKEGGHRSEIVLVRTRQDVQNLCKKISANKPTVIGFSATSSQFPYLKIIARSVRAISDAMIVCGGIHPTLKPECIHAVPELNAIVRGEGEFAFLDLAQALERSSPYSGIENFWFKTQSGSEIIKNDIRDLMENLDELPFPDKDSLDYQKIIDAQGGVARFMFSRGCVFDCPYCSNKAIRGLYDGRKGRYFRLRSPQKAVEEIRKDSTRFSFDKIFFDDDIISIDKKWFYDFFALYKKQFRYPFYCNIRVGHIDRDMIKLLKDAGAAGVVVGIEHGNEEFRKTVLKRDISNDQIIQTVRMCEEEGIKDNYGQIMIGLPHEKEGLFFDTVRLCRKINLKYFRYIFHPYPGTEFNRLCEEQQWLPSKEIMLEREEAVISYPGFSRCQIQFCYDLFEVLVKWKAYPLNKFSFLMLYPLFIYASLKNYMFKKIFRQGEF